PRHWRTPLRCTPRTRARLIAPAAAALPILPARFRSFRSFWVRRHDLWSRRRPVCFTIRAHFRGLRLELRAVREESQQILDRRGGEGNALVCRPEQLIARDSRRQIRLGIEPSQAAQAVAIIEEPGVEKIRRLAPGLDDKPTESKHFACQSKSEKIVAKLTHRQEGETRRILPVNSALSPRPRLVSCASSRSTSTASARPNARA